MILSKTGIHFSGSCLFLPEGYPSAPAGKRFAALPLVEAGTVGLKLILSRLPRASRQNCNCAGDILREICRRHLPCCYARMPARNGAKRRRAAAKARPRRPWRRQVQAKRQPPCPSYCRRNFRRRRRPMPHFRKSTPPPRPRRRRLRPARSGWSKIAEFQPLPVLVGPGECGADRCRAMAAVILPDQNKVAVSPPATCAVRWPSRSRNGCVTMSRRR